MCILNTTNEETFVVNIDVRILLKNISILFISSENKNTH